MIRFTDVPEFLVDFEAFELKKTKILWVSKLLKEDAGFEKKFLEKFSFQTDAINTYFCSDLNREKAVVMQAERYGGAGTNKNGGGARSGIINNQQIKGVGKNKLAADDADIWHSYGGLTAIDAVYEAALSIICKNVLSIGSVDHHGVILTGEKSAYYYDLSKTHGALLIRSPSIRPAHFLRNAMFLSDGMESDHLKTKLCCKALLKTVGGENGLLSLIREFVSNCANQFSLAFLIRFFHGSVSPSNISIDGRWLDLVNAGFTPSGINYGGPFPVHDEWKKIPGIIDELVHTINKYGNTNIESNKLVLAYYDLFNRYTALYLPIPLGLPCGKGPHKGSGSIALITKIRETIIGSGRVETEWPSSVNINDPFYMLIKELYIFFIVKNISKTGENSAIKDISENQYYRDFETLVLESYSIYQLDNPSVPLGAFAISCAVTSLSRFFISSSFYKWSLEKRIREILQENDYLKISELIDFCDDLSKDLFGHNLSDPVVIYKDKEISLVYFCRTGETSLTIESDNYRLEKKYSRFMDLAKDIHSTGIPEVNLIGFNLKEYISVMSILINQLEFFCFFEKNRNEF